MGWAKRGWSGLRSALALAIMAAMSAEGAKVLRAGGWGAASTARNVMAMVSLRGRIPRMLAHDSAYFEHYPTSSMTQPGRLAGWLPSKTTRRVFGNGMPVWMARW